MRHRCIKRYICIYIYHANKLPAPGVAICAAFTSNDPSRARLRGEKCNAKERMTRDTNVRRRYSYLAGLFIVDFLLISKVDGG